MRKFRYLLFFIAVISFSVFQSCGGASDKESIKDTTQVNNDQLAPEEKADTLAK